MVRLLSIHLLMRMRNGWCMYWDRLVEADYTVIFFATGSNHAPSWNWVWKAYRSLNRKYRKNLKQLVCAPHIQTHYTYWNSVKYIVHSSLFSKGSFECFLDVACLFSHFCSTLLLRRGNDQVRFAQEYEPLLNYLPSVLNSFAKSPTSPPYRSLLGMCH